MTHALAQEARSGNLRDFHELSGKLLDPTLDFGTKIDRLLSTETDRFDLSYGFLTRVDPSADVQEIVAAHGSHELLQSGQTGPLSASYCRKTVTQADGTMWRRYGAMLSTPHRPVGPTGIPGDPAVPPPGVCDRSE